MMVALVCAQGLLVVGTMATTPAAHRLSFWLPAALVFAVVVLLFSRNLVRMARRVATFQLTMGPNVLRIVQQGMTPTEVFRHDVRKIVEYPPGLRIVFGAGRLVGVPRYVDDYEAARARLAAWHAIERRSATVSRILIVVPVLGVVVGGLPLPGTVLVAVNAAWAASLALWLWRISRTALSKKQRAGNYVTFGVLLVWALWRLATVWR
ncbi:MAG TPA: hypothetical protein VF334_11220 [Polyangia bacterium]